MARTITTAGLPGVQVTVTNGQSSFDGHQGIAFRVHCHHTDTGHWDVVGVILASPEAGIGWFNVAELDFDTPADRDKVYNALLLDGAPFPTSDYATV